MRTPEGRRTRSVLALMGREIRDSALEVDGERQQDAGEELRQIRRVDPRAARAPAVAVSGERRFRPAVLRREHDGQEVRGVEGQAVEDRPERTLQVVDGLIAEAGAPARFHDGGRERQMSPARRAASVVRTTTSSWGGFRSGSPAGGVSDDVPPAPEASEEQPVRAGPARSSATVMPASSTYCSTADHRT